MQVTMSNIRLFYCLHFFFYKITYPIQTGYVLNSSCQKWFRSQPPEYLIAQKP